MNWFDWVLVGYFVVSTLTIIGIIDKPRKPIDGTTGAIVVLWYCIFIVLLLWTHGVFS